MKGNVEVNSVLECNLFCFEKPLAFDALAYRRQFIKQKYTDKKFIAANNYKRLEREFDINVTIHRGWLTKVGEENKTWKKRWFVLHEDQLVYLTNKTDTYITGSVPIDYNSMVFFVDENQEGKKNAFAVLTNKRNYIMYTESEEETLQWVYRLRATVYFICLQQITLDKRNFLMDERENDVTKTGYLVKKGGTFATLKKRYFILKKGSLSYYNDNKSAEPIQSIPMKGAILDRDEKTSLKVTYADRQFFLSGETEKEIDEWKHALEESIRRESNSDIIEKKSHQIHSLILNKLIKQNLEETVSPHSPLMWRTLSFHRASAPTNTQSVAQSKTRAPSLIPRRESILQVGRDDVVKIQKTYPKSVDREKKVIAKKKLRKVPYSLFEALHHIFNEEFSKSSSVSSK